MRRAPRNEIDLLDISYEELLQKYSPLVNNFAKCAPVDEQEDYKQEACLTIWQGHQAWVNYQNENGARECGRTKGSFTSFVSRRLSWKKQDLFRQRAALFLLPDYEMSDPKQLQDLLDAELRSEFSPGAREYIEARMSGNARTCLKRRERDAALAEIAAWRDE